MAYGTDYNLIWLQTNDNRWTDVTKIFATKSGEIYSQVISSVNYENTWLKHSIVVDGLDFEYTVEVASTGTIIWNYTNSFTSTLENGALGIVVGFNSVLAQIKEIKVKSL